MSAQASIRAYFGGVMRFEHVIVMPVYEDAASLMKLLRDLHSSLGDQIYIVAVDDGSVREPVQPDWISEAGLSGVVLSLHRNMGHQRAIAIGLSYVAEHVDAEYVVVMDSDGEDKPETIPALLVALQDPSVDVAVARRKKRVESLRFKAFYAVYKRLFALLVGRNVDFGNFMAMRMSGVKRLGAMSELWIHIAATVIASKLRIRPIPLDRGARYAGKSKMNFVGLALHGFRSMMVFAEDVLVRVGVFCTIIATFTVIAIAIAITMKVIGSPTPGWFSNVVLSLTLIFLQTGALTLMTLLTTGVIKSVTAQPPDYRQFVETATPAAPARQPAAAFGGMD